jgi:nicotinamide-nucleotide amidase
VSLASDVLDALRRRHWHVATAESCTGGMIAAALTDVAGSSDVVDRGYVTYSNAAKSDLLGVDPTLIAAHGAVSREVAEAMAAGALARAGVDIAVAVTGIAGPGGGSAAKPVGLVWFGLATKGEPPRSLRKVFSGGRAEVRAAATRQALTLLLEKAAGAP